MCVCVEFLTYKLLGVKNDKYQVCTAHTMHQNLPQFAARSHKGNYALSEFCILTQLNSPTLTHKHSVPYFSRRLVANWLDTQE